MPTDNPRVAAYLPPQTFKCLKAFCKENRLSISEGVGRIMSEYFGVLPNELPSGTDWENRLQAVEGELVKVVGVAERIIAVESALATLQLLVSEQHGKLHTSTLETDGKTPSSSPSNTPEIDSNLPSSSPNSTHKRR